MKQLLLQKRSIANAIPTDIFDATHCYLQKRERNTIINNKYIIEAFMREQDMKIEIMEHIKLEKQEQSQGGLKLDTTPTYEYQTRLSLIELMPIGMW